MVNLHCQHDGLKNYHGLIQVVMAHTFNLSTREAEAGGSLCEIEVILTYRASSRTGSKVTQGNLVSNKQTNEKKHRGFTPVSDCFLKD